MAGDGSGWLLKGVGGGGGGCAGAGVITRHVGRRVRRAVVILSVLALTEGGVTWVFLQQKRHRSLVFWTTSRNNKYNKR